MKRDERDEIIAYLVIITFLLKHIINSFLLTVMEQFIHYIGLAYFQQPIRAMQFNAAKLQKQSRFKSCFKTAFFWSSFKKQRSAAQRSAARRMLRLKAQRSAAYVWTHLHANAAQRSSSHAAFKSNMHLQRSAAQRMCERTFNDDSV
mgnify:CR=1 FL=1